MQILSLALWLVAAAGTLTAGPVIHGIVVDETDGTPVGFAWVTLRDSIGSEVQTVQSGEDGRFTMEVTAGTYSFTVRRLGYERVTTPSLEVAADVETVDMTLAVPQVRVVLEPVTVEGERLSVLDVTRLRGFNERRERGLGTYLTPKQVRERHPSRFTDLLRAIAGVHVFCQGTGWTAGHDCNVSMGRQPPSMASILNPRDVEGCRVSYYIDGAKYRPGDRGIDELPITTVLAVEVYRGASQTPAEFLDSDSRCGVIVIWTGIEIDPR